MTEKCHSQRMGKFEGKKLVIGFQLEEDLVAREKDASVFLVDSIRMEYFIIAP